MNEKWMTVAGKVYRGEILHQTALGGVVVFPSWLGGSERVSFVSLGEAQGFIDAHQVVVGVLFSSYPKCMVEA